jgi:hypothetical protein
MYDVNRMISDSMRIISEAIKIRHPEMGQLADDGRGEFSCDTFVMRSFSWDDTRPNFEYLDYGASVSWHQHAGRVTEHNYIPNTQSMLLILQHCLKEFDI